MAWLQTISRGHAEGALAQVYAAMAARKIPEVYVPPHGDAPGIIRAHSLDARLMQLTFGATGALHATSLPWPERELFATATSRTNQCFY
jgi:hypothetical protein